MFRVFLCVMMMLAGRQGNGSEIRDPRHDSGGRGHAAIGHRVQKGKLVQLAERVFVCKSGNRQFRIDEFLN